MRLLVTGAAGLLGGKVLERAGQTGHEAVGADVAASGDIRALDITDPEDVDRMVSDSAPDWVVNTAAYTAVDESEGDAGRVEAVNVDGALNLQRAARASGARFLTLSTDYVFDGTDGPYAEDAPRRPLGTYGRSKALMEERLETEGGHRLIVRTMVLYGAAPGVRKNFGLWVVESLEAGDSIRVVTDQTGNPTLASDLARLLVGMMEQEASGIYHAAGADLVSRHEFALRTAEVFGLDAGLIQAVTTEELGQRADRPLKSGLVTTRLSRDLGLVPMGLDESLEVFRQEYEFHGGRA